MAEPFFWGAGGKKISSPEQASRNRAVAEALMNRPAADSWQSGLANFTNGLVGMAQERDIAEQEAAGRERAGGLFANLAVNADPNSIIAALTSPDAAWASPAQTSIASALLNSGLERQDPMYQLGLEKAQLELEAMRNPSQQMDPTSAIQNYEYLVGAGIDPTQAQGMAFGGGGTTINNMGNIPAGYQLVTDPVSGAQSMAPIHGSPAAAEAESAAAKRDLQGAGRDLVTDTIVSGAQNARSAAKGFAATGLGNAVTGGLGFTPAGELNRYVQSLKAIAASENINAMRQSSPTGGALGNTSDADLRLLENKAGALDPQSPNFERQLDDYERTLLRIVHGYEAGDAIFEATRPGTGRATDIPVGTVEEGYRYKGGPLADPNSWQKVN